MSQKLYVRRGGGAATATEVTNMLGRKGAPFLDGSTPLINMGRRAADGEASQGNFILWDPDAEIHSTTYRLSPHALVTWTDDSSGDELWLARSRIAPLESGRPYTYTPDNLVEWDVQVNDNNMDLRGQAFTEPWERPRETDLARIHALRNYTLNGSSSTAPHSRTSCNITADHDVNGHLISTAFSRIMPARTYPPGTQPQDVIAECAERSGKTYAVVIHHTGGSSHDCLLYVGALDHTTYVTDVKVSDQLSDWDPDDATAPVFDPIWDRGKGTLTENDDVVSGVVVIYGGTNDDPESVFVHDPADEDPYEYWVESINDDKVDTDEEAENLAQTYFTSHRAPGHRTHRFSILMKASQHHLIAAGMSMQVKSAVIAGGADLGTYVWRRITELRWEPHPDPDYLWAHIDLEKVLRRRGLGAQPIATTPHPPNPGTSGEPASCAIDVSSLDQISTPNSGFETGTTANWTINGIGGAGVVGPATGDWEGDYYYDMGGSGYIYYTVPSGYTFEAGTTYVARIRCVNVSGSTKFRFGFDADDETDSAEGTLVDLSGWDEYCVEWTPSADRTGNVQVGLYTEAGFDAYAVDDVRIYAGSSGTEPDAPPPASDDDTGSIGDTGSGCYATCDHQHPLPDLTAHQHAEYLTNTLGAKEVLSVVADAGSTIELNLADGNAFDLTLTDDCDVSVVGATDGRLCWITILARQDGTGGHCVNLDTPFVMVDGGDLAIDQTADHVSVIKAFTVNGGTDWFTYVVGAGSGGSGISAGELTSYMAPLTVFDPTSGNYLPLVDGDGNQLVSEVAF